MPRVILRILLPLVVLSLCPAAAQAGQYTISSCNDVRGSDGWVPQGSASVAANPDCSVSSNGGAPYFANGQVIFTAPPGAAVVGVRGRYDSTQQGGWQVGIFDFDAPAGGRRWLWCGSGTSCTTYGQSPEFRADSFRSTRVGVLQICGNQPSCGPPSSFHPKDVYVTIEDFTQPSLSVDVPSGWVRGRQDVGVSASDNVGIKLRRLFVDGAQRDNYDRGCSFSATVPCPNGPTTFALETAGTLADGEHSVTVVAVDSADNAVTADRRLHIDNTAPGQVVGLAVEGGEGWRRQKEFDLSWQTPSQPGVAPIAAVEYEVCPVGVARGAQSCQRGTRAAADFLSVGSGESGRLSMLRDVEVPGTGEWAASVWLRDEAGNQNPETARTVTLRFDDVPPVSAFRPLDPADPTRVRVASVDALSGVAEATIELQRRGESSWQALPVAREDGGFAASLDDLNLPDGAYTLRARAVDFAGNERSTTEYADGQSAGLALPVRIKSRLAVGKPRQVRARSNRRRFRTTLVSRPEVSYGRPVRLQGRLTTPGANALPGSSLQVFEQVLGSGASPRPIGTVTTSRTGRFSFRISKGPSRIIAFRYGGTKTIRSDEGQVDLRVRASTSFEVSRRSVVNGQAVAFSGRLRGGNVPAEGKLIAVQAFSRGRWRPFATTRASAQTGRWRYTYRFDGTRGKVRYRFRARVLREATYPFTTGTSDQRRVLVRGIGG